MGEPAAGRAAPRQPRAAPCRTQFPLPGRSAGWRPSLGPAAHLHPLALDLQALHGEVHADGAALALREGPGFEALYEAGLAHAGVPDEDQLEEEVVAFLGVGTGPRRCRARHGAAALSLPPAAAEGSRALRSARRPPPRRPGLAWARPSPASVRSLPPAMSGRAAGGAASLPAPPQPRLARWPAAAPEPVLEPRWDGADSGLGPTDTRHENSVSCHG